MTEIAMEKFLKDFIDFRTKTCMKLVEYIQENQRLVEVNKNLRRQITQLLTKGED